MRGVALECLFLILLSFIAPPSAADLPIHAVTAEAVGVWRLFETALSPDFQACGGSFPNRSGDNLRIDDYRQYLNEIYGTLSETLVELSIDRVPRPGLPPPRCDWRFFAVKRPQTDQVIGHW